MRRAGLSLVETLLAVALVAVALVPIVGCWVHLAASTRSLAGRGQSYRQMREQLVRLRASDPARLLSLPGVRVERSGSLVSFTVQAPGASHEQLKGLVELPEGPELPAWSRR